MEREPTSVGGGPEQADPWALANIQAGIEAAECEQRAVDHRTAKLIAQRVSSDFRAAPDSALGALSRCGVILEDDVYQELYADIEGQSPEQARMVDALRSYCAQRSWKGPTNAWRDEFERQTESGIQPQIWVGSLSDYNAGHLHGLWVDAWQEPEDLRAIVGWLLRSSPMPDAEEYGIFDHQDFCGVELGEYALLDRVSRLAQGIAEHGEPYAAWVSYLGLEHLDDAERTFQDAYQGQWESMEAYVEQYLDDGDAYSFKEFVPEWLRDYVKVDVERMAGDWEAEYHVVEASGGGVFVFDPRY